MKARVGLAAALLLLGAACGESREAVAPAADVAAPAEDAGMAIDPAKARVFLTFQAKMLEVAQKMYARGAELEAHVQTGRYDGKDGVGDAAQQLDELREELGLSESDVSSLSEIAAGVLARGAGTALSAQVAELEKSLDALPPEQRGEAENALRELREMKGSIVDMKDARARYGDAIVDAMLALEPELRSQYRLLAGGELAQP